MVVNDYTTAAEEVAAEIVADGGAATAMVHDVGDWAVGDLLIRAAVAEFGSFDILVNNAGITRDRMLFNLSEQDWDDVLRINLKGHAATVRAATAFWRVRAKSEPDGLVYGRVVNTASEAFLFGSPGQANYAAAKAGVVTLTLGAARAMKRYGVTANAICPRARTGMTAGVYGTEAPEQDPLDPGHVATLVRYLCSPAAGEITRQVLICYGRMVALMQAPAVAGVFTADGDAFTPDELDGTLGAFVRDAGGDSGFAAMQLATLFDAHH